MILDEIVAHKKKQLEIEKAKTPIGVLLKEVERTAQGRDFAGALKGDGINVIAEIKRASPSRGIIRGEIAPADIAKLYEKGGADAISVLTESKYFMGDDKFIREVKEVVPCPVLRKDFIIDEYQVYQSKALGADAVLLIVAILGSGLKRFYNLAKSLGLECLVEVHDEYEMDIAVTSGAEIIGINNRNLKDFTVSLKTTEKLIKLVPQNVVKVSESGIKTADDVRYLKSLGVDAFLIGEALMKSEDIVGELRKLKGVTLWSG
jgi:indole-3-glycerol phosphate synthase